MHDHRTAPCPALGAPGSSAFHDQRWVLLELIVDPPACGDALVTLAGVLDRPVEAVERAVAALEQAGLARREGDRAVATTPALGLEWLWPIKP